MSRIDSARQAPGTCARCSDRLFAARHRTYLHSSALASGETQRSERVALNLFGVTVYDAHVTDLQVPDAMLVTVRDIAAICGATEYHPTEPDDATVQHFADVVAAYGARGPVLPSPVGVVFRSEESVQRWLELHYSTLTDALSYVENRVAARVHVRRAHRGEARDANIDLATIAVESVRVLRIAAVASLPLRMEGQAGVVLSAAFLVEDELWKDFVAEVEAQGKTTTSVRFEIAGPWPPYDFVQMQLGA